MKPEIVSTLPASAVNLASVKVSPSTTAAEPGSPAGRQAVTAPGQESPPAARSTEENPVSLAQTVSELNDYVQNLNRSLQFSVDEATGRTVIKVIDPESKEVIRQIPQEEILAIARMLREDLKGALLEEQA